MATKNATRRDVLQVLGSAATRLITDSMPHRELGQAVSLYRHLQRATRGILIPPGLKSAVALLGIAIREASAQENGMSPDTTTR